VVAAEEMLFRKQQQTNKEYEITRKYSQSFSNLDDSPLKFFFFLQISILLFKTGSKISETDTRTAQKKHSK